MKEQRIIDALGNVDEKYIEEAIPGRKKLKRPMWIRWTAIAACFADIICGAFMWKNHDNDIIEIPEVEETVAYGFTMGDVIYYPIAFQERIRYGLVPEDAMGLTTENTYKITESDLGDVMGTVEASENESIVGATVYHFINFTFYFIFYLYIISCTI